MSSYWRRERQRVGFFVQLHSLEARVHQGDQVEIVSDPRGETGTPVVADDRGILIGCTN